MTYPKERAESELIRAHHAAEAVYRTTSGPLAWIVDATHVSGATPRERAIVAEYEKRVEDAARLRCAAVGIVIPNALTRGLYTAIRWIAPARYPCEIFAGYGQAERWARLRLKAALSESADAAPLERNKATASVSHADRSLAAERGCVLVVDESETERAQIATALPGFVVHTAYDAISAFGLCAAHNPSLIILNFELPDLHGAEVVRRLKGNIATRRIPILATSVLGAAFAARAIGAGADAYLAKPVQGAALHQAALDLLNSSRSGR